MIPIRFQDDFNTCIGYKLQNYIFLWFNSPERRFGLRFLTILGRKIRENLVPHTKQMNLLNTKTLNKKKWERRRLDKWRMRHHFSLLLFVFRRWLFVFFLFFFFRFVFVFTEEIWYDSKWGHVVVTMTKHRKWANSKSKKGRFGEKRWQKKYEITCQNRERKGGWRRRNIRLLERKNKKYWWKIEKMSLREYVTFQDEDE